MSASSSHTSTRTCRPYESDAIRTMAQTPYSCRPWVLVPPIAGRSVPRPSPLDPNPSFGGSEISGWRLMVGGSRPYGADRGLSLELFACAMCGATPRQIDDGRPGEHGLCAACGERRTADAAVRESLRWRPD